MKSKIATLSLLAACVAPAAAFAFTNTENSTPESVGVPYEYTPFDLAFAGKRGYLSASGIPGENFFCQGVRTGRISTTAIFAAGVEQGFVSEDSRSDSYFSALRSISQSICGR